MIPTILFSLGLVLALYRVLDNRSYLRGREEMRRRYCPNRSPDPYERSLREENRRLMCAALVFGVALIVNVTLLS